MEVVAGRVVAAAAGAARMKQKVVNKAGLLLAPLS